LRVTQVARDPAGGPLLFDQSGSDWVGTLAIPTRGRSRGLHHATGRALSWVVRRGNHADYADVRCGCSTGVVFDHLTTPSNLRAWQTSKTSVEQLTEGPPGIGTQVRERTKPPGGKEFEQIVEFTEFDRPRRFHVHIVEGPQRIDGTWVFEAAGGGTKVSFTAEGDLQGPMRFIAPIAQRMMARQFADYHRNLRVNVAP
jgi:Polyketide cyclase / dehydrase and lipid transport